MNNEDMAAKLSELEQRSKSNTKRIDKLEENSKALNELTVAVREMVIKQDYTKDSIDKLDKKLGGIDIRMENLEHKPAKRYESVVEKIILTVIAILVGFIFAQIGIK